MKLWRFGRGILLTGVLLSVTPWQVAQAASAPKKVCAHVPKAGSARCQASVVTDGTGHALASSSPRGYGPADFYNAYHMPNRAGRPVTLAIVDAYDAPHIKADLDVYNRAYGLPAFPTCANGGQSSCFTKVDQRGGTNYPKVNAGWAVEISLDVQTAHAMCQNCRIVLVEADSPSMSDLAKAVDQAVAQGATVVSNSYGGPESPDESTYDGHYHRAGVTMTVSSGDSGYGASYPAASPYVVAVGGTTLNLRGAQVASETAWIKSGSGCSTYEFKPGWQHDVGCARRSIADIAADADPATGAAIYDSYPNGGRSGWLMVGGTSLAAPLVAGMIAASGNPTGTGASQFYARAGLRDIVGGRNGSCKSYICQSIAGYDGPTGLGVLNGM